MAVVENYVEGPDLEKLALEPAPELNPSVPVKLAYSFGQAIESGYLIVAGFVFFYYTAVLGLSGSAVGVALAISMCVDAVMDPLIGSISDNVRSKWGRRLPLMLLGAPATGLAVWMLFAPPAMLSPFLLFGWLVASKLLLRGFASVYNLPYAALGAEMASGYVERASVAAYRGVFGIVISLVITAVAMTGFFAGGAGLQNGAAYPAFGAAIGLLLFACAALAMVGVWRYAVRLPQPRTQPAPMFLGLFRELPEVFRNKSFRALFLTALLFWVAAGVNGALNNHAYVFVWKIPPERIQFISYSYFLSMFLGIPLARLLLARFEKNTIIIQGLILVLLAMTVLHSLRALGLFAPTGAEAQPWLMTSAGVAGIGIGLIIVALPAMMADAADEHELLFGHRREGLYFAGLGFAGKAAAGLGQMAAGFALDALHFPKTAGVGAAVEIPEHVQRLLILAWGPLAAFFGLLGLLALLPYGVTRARHAEIAAALKIKRAEEAAAAE
ncbi:MFS transporter [Phenylobacterium sp.]|uniref:MFS transporter n=1 Tax=Phenylobacterium sp. TaxID=1871053 RepID=UPI0025CE1545|nr:MFS transporter [Phenylobacterium sp.]